MQKLLVKTLALAFVASALFISTTSEAQQPTAPSQGGQQVIEKQQKANAAIWIDVRSAEEFNAGHLAGAVNIPHEQIAARIAEVTQDKDAEIFLYCRSGRRSGLALEALQGIGFSKVVNAGGYEALKEKAAKK